MIRRVVVDALQIAPTFSGIGRTIQQIGEALTAEPLAVPVTLRCAADAVEVLAPAFPPGTRVETPLASSRPRWRRYVQQYLAAPLRDQADTLLVCPGDQGPPWGRAPVMLVTHDLRRLSRPETAGRGERAFYRLVQPRALRHADLVVAVSRFGADEIRRLVPGAAPIEVVARHPKPRVSGPRSNPAGPVVSLGALRPYKGVADLLDAYARHGDRLPPLTLIGGDEGAGSWVAERIRDENLSARVTALGWLPDAELEALYDRCLATVHPSHFEGYGLPLAESLARGLPTAASAIPPHREIGGVDGALWFEPGDVEAIATALERIAADPQERLQLAARGLARSRELAAQGPGWREVLAQALRAATTR